MPIGDILAQIQGASATATNLSPVPKSKRKPDNDGSDHTSVVSKAPRLAGSTNLTARPATTLSRSQSTAPADRSVDCTPARPRSAAANPATRPAERAVLAVRNQASTSLPARPPIAAAGGAKPTSADGRAHDTLASKRASTSSPASASATVKRLHATSSVVSKPDPGPKKGSYAELMARASQMQAMIPRGVIKHQPHEAIRKSMEQSRLGKQLSLSADASIHTRPRASTTRNSTGIGGAVAGKTQIRTNAKEGKKAAPPPEPVKRVKKTALASTGYQGTARPQSSPAIVTASGAAKTNGGVARSDVQSKKGVNPLAAFSKSQRHGKPKQEEDSDLDDFIVDDDDDDENDRPAGDRYYDSDGSSDMEAGVDDVWNEEAEAAAIARLEDAKEEALLKQRAREKARRMGRV